MRNQGQEDAYLVKYFEKDLVLNEISDGADIRLFDYPNRIRLFLGLLSPTFRCQIQEVLSLHLLA